MTAYVPMSSGDYATAPDPSNTDPFTRYEIRARVDDFDASPTLHGVGGQKGSNFTANSGVAAWIRSTGVVYQHVIPGGATANSDALPKTGDLIDAKWLSIAFEVTDFPSPVTHTYTVRYSKDETLDHESVSWTTVSEKTGSVSGSVEADYTLEGLIAINRSTHSTGSTGVADYYRMVFLRDGEPYADFYPNQDAPAAAATTWDDRYGNTWTVNSTSVSGDPAAAYVPTVVEDVAYVRFDGSSHASTPDPGYGAYTKLETMIRVDNFDLAHSLDPFFALAGQKSDEDAVNGWALRIANALNDEAGRGAPWVNFDPGDIPRAILPGHSSTLHPTGERILNAKWVSVVAQYSGFPDGTIEYTVRVSSEETVDLLPSDWAVLATHTSSYTGLSASNIVAVGDLVLAGLPDDPTEYRSKVDVYRAIVLANGKSVAEFYPDRDADADADTSWSDPHGNVWTITGGASVDGVPNGPRIPPAVTRFTSMEDAVNDGRVRLSWRHELVDTSDVVLATTDPDDVNGDVIHWGATMAPVSFDAQKVSQRTAQLTVPVNDPLLVPNRVGSMLHPDSGNVVRSSAGIEQSSGQMFWVSQETLKPNQVTAKSESGAGVLTVSLVDTLVKVRSDFINGFAFEDGEPVENVISRLLEPVVTGVDVSPTGFTTPAGNAEQGSSRETLLLELLEGVGHEISTTADGRPFTRPVLPSAGSDAKRWRYGQSDGLPIQSASRTWNVKSPQGWRVEGGSNLDATLPVTLTVYDTDPSSEGYFRGAEAAQIRSSRIPWVRSNSQAAACGYGNLRKFSSGPMVVSFQSFPNPSLRVGDLVEFEDDVLNADGLFRVISKSLPMQVDGMMTVVIRKVFEPALNYLSPAADPKPEPETGKHCLTGFVDDFDRADGNLENVPNPVTGEDDWVEFGLSWGVYKRKATQRGRGLWSFAMLNTPLCSSNQFVTLNMVRPRAGLSLGPMLRSSGTHEGYFCRQDTNGHLSLEIWIDGKVSKVIGSHNAGGFQPVLTLRAVGNRITVDTESQVSVIDVRDNSMTGTFVGMHALGDYQGSGPEVTLFECGFTS